MKIFNLLLLGAIIFSCNDHQKCEKTICTEEFRTITVSVKDGNGNTVTLDSFEVIVSDSGDNVTTRLSQNFDLGNEYPIMDDSFVDEIDQKEWNIQFIGKLNDQTVTEHYIVSADCCHIFLVSGETTIIL